MKYHSWLVKNWWTIYRHLSQKREKNVWGNAELLLVDKLRYRRFGEGFLWETGTKM